MHRNANLVTQKQQEKVRRVGGCAAWERSVSLLTGILPQVLLSVLGFGWHKWGADLPWWGHSAVRDPPGLSCTFLLFPHLWQLFLKLAQTKSSLEDSGEHGDIAYWFGGGRGRASHGVGGRGWKLSHRSSETRPEIQEATPVLEKPTWPHHTPYIFPHRQELPAEYYFT